MHSEQYQLVSRPRHMRYVYLIDENYGYDNLQSLFHINQRYWGGRYNPIVPVVNNVIEDAWKQFVKHYDPDIIFYTNGINIDLIKPLQLFNPAVYANIQEEPRSQDLTGVDALYLLSQEDKRASIFLGGNLHSVANPLVEFYKLNFGIQKHGIVSDIDLTRYFDCTTIDASNLAAFNTLFHQKRPVIQAHLSRRNLNTKILRSAKYLGAWNSFEIVIAKDKTSSADQYYYWNRQMYKCQNVMYVTIEELNELLKDAAFGEVLDDMSAEQLIYVLSTSLTQAEVEEIIATGLKPIAKRNLFQYRAIGDFPFEVLDESGLYERDYGESESVQVLAFPKGVYQVPKLSFTNSVSYYPQQWAVDIGVRTTTPDSLNAYAKLWPRHADSRWIFPQVGGRVNQSHNISIFLMNQLLTSSTLVINIPFFKELMQQIVSRPVIDGIVGSTSYDEIGLHDSSYRLTTFFKLFGGDMNTINEFFTDKFWVDLFEHLTTNNEPAGDAITLDEIKARCMGLLSVGGITLGTWPPNHRNEHNLYLGLKNTVSELCHYSVFQKGYKLKCSNCSSKFWYHLGEVKDKVRCKGCLQDFTLPVEVPFAYKLNDLVKNNIFQSKTQRDGNLTVIRTLIRLKDRANFAFEYTPQLNLFAHSSATVNKPLAELDICCMIDGKLVIGEAKHESNAFFWDGSKSLKSLEKVAREIRPDKIVLSCYVDTNGTKLDNAKKSLIHYFNRWEYTPEIETILLSEPDYYELTGHRYFYY